MKFNYLLAAAGLSVIVQANVPAVKLNNGVMMPAIAAGTWQFSPAVAQQSVHDAFAAGFTHIDTAHDYDNQGGVGKALSGRTRDTYFLTTKVPGCGLQGISKAHCAADTTKAIEEDLKQLGLDSLDLLLIHFPPVGGCSSVLNNCEAIQSQWAALEAAYAQKKTKAIGVSNFCISCFECLKKTMKITPAVNQVQYHVGMGPDPGGLKSYCTDLGVHMQAYSPLGNNASALIDGPVLGNIGKSHNKSAVQVALQWIWSNGVPVVTKSTKPVHLQEDLDIFDWTTTAAEKKVLDSQTKPTGKPSFMCSS
jgi:2,5-diketo-D-gluconate reductase A|eukprot:g1753.t1